MTTFESGRERISCDLPGFAWCEVPLRKRSLADCFVRMIAWGIVRNDRTYWLKDSKDVYEVFELLNYRAAKVRLRKVVISKIFDSAWYWLKTVTFRADYMAVKKSKSSCAVTTRVSVAIRNFVESTRDCIPGSISWFRRKSGRWVDFGQEHRHLTANVHACSKIRENCIVMGNMLPNGHIHGWSALSLETELGLFR